MFLTNANNIAQYSENKMQFAGIEAHLMDKKKNGNLLEIKLGNQYRLDDLMSGFQIKNNNTIIKEPLPNQNNFTYLSNDLYIKSKYSLKLKKLSLLAQIEMHQVFNTIKTTTLSLHQNPFFINPTVGFNWKINKKNKFLTYYSFNTTNATITNIYPNYIQTGFRSFSKGTGEFNQLNNSIALLNYSYGSWGDNFFANTFLMFTKDHDFFSTNSILAQNYYLSESILIKDRKFTTLSSTIDRYFKIITTNLKLNLSGTISNYKNIVNNSQLREVKTNTLNYGFELRSGFKGFFNYNVGSKWDFNEVKTTTSNSFTNNMSFLDFSLMISDKLSIQLQTERYFFGNLEKDNNQYYFMDLEARYVVKDNKLTFFLSGNNLFNTETFRNYSISDIAISKTEYRLQPRYVLFKMEYRF